MNREQLGIVIIAGLAIITLSASAPTYAAIVAESSENVGSGSAVFSEDVTLEDSPNPQDRDLSGSKFLEALYDTVGPSGDSENTSNETEAAGGENSLLPIAIALGSLLCIGIAGTIGWFWRLRRNSEYETSPFDTGSHDEQAVTDESTRGTLEQLDIEDLSNDVYRSWYALMENIDLQARDSYTPHELAELAIEDGFDQAAVLELTKLFETVRYGPAAVTPETERRARKALSQLERKEDNS